MPQPSPLLLFFLLITGSLLHQVSVECFSFAECNVTKSCWHHPPFCSPQDCISGVEWTVEEDGLLIEIQGQMNDLEPTMAHYISVGFSYNERMGDDTVLECIQPLIGDPIVRVSFNDETDNHVLPQASEVLLADPVVSFVDGLLTCQAKFLFDRRGDVDELDQFKIHDLESGEYHLLFARGNANSRTLEKDIHSTNDGAQFPWISRATVTFCRPGNCTADQPQFYSVTDSKQTDVERYWRYRIAVLHGVALLVAWWVLGSSAILLARYFKPLWPRKKLLGTALHRDLFLASLVLQVLAVVFIFYQAGWVWYECSYECDSDAFSKKMHAITGVVATVLALLQPVSGFLRPNPNSDYRPIFNWIHWFIGMTAWSFASATFILSLPMGKTGLNRVYGHAPNYVMGGYIVVFFLCNVLLEILSSSSSEVRIEKNEGLHSFVVGPSGMSLSVLNGPTVESPVATPKRATARVIIFITHFVVALGVAITITTMLVKILLSHSP